mgnify:CR=1 FL=1
MENDKEKPQNGAAQPSKGTSVPKGEAQGKKNEVKEGDAEKQRPEFGADGGTNTSSREDQLPSLNDGGQPHSDAGGGESELEDEKSGSDADHDHGGNASV